MRWVFSLATCAIDSGRPLATSLRILFYGVKEPYGGFRISPLIPSRIQGRDLADFRTLFPGEKFAGTDYEGSGSAGRFAGDRCLHGTQPLYTHAALGLGRHEKVGHHARSAAGQVYPTSSATGITARHRGDAELVEDTTNDLADWADGGDGGWRNRLGQLLMELRAQLR